MRGVSFTFHKLGDAKFKVKMRRANINMEARGATRDYDSRGGRSAAMDPSTAHPGGQKRQERSRDGGDDRGAPAARGGNSGSTAARGFAEQPDGDHDADFGGEDEGATPTADPGADVLAPGTAEQPSAADDVAATASPATEPTTATHAACTEEARDRPSEVDS